MAPGLGPLWNRHSRVGQKRLGYSALGLLTGLAAARRAKLGLLCIEPGRQFHHPLVGDELEARCF